MKEEKITSKPFYVWNFQKYGFGWGKYPENLHWLHWRIKKKGNQNPNYWMETNFDNYDAWLTGRKNHGIYENYIILF